MHDPEAIATVIGTLYEQLAQVRDIIAALSTDDVLTEHLALAGDALHDALEHVHSTNRDR